MNIRKQGGLTLIGFFITLAVVLFFAYAAVRITPMYLEYFSLTQALTNLKEDPASRSMAPRQIKARIMANLWVSYADNNIQEKHIRVTKKADGVNVRVVYEVRKPFLGNIDVIGTFDRNVVLR